MSEDLKLRIREIHRQINRHYYTKILPYTLRRWLTPVVSLLRACIDVIPTRRRNLDRVLFKYDGMAGGYISGRRMAFEQPHEILANLDGKPALVRSDLYFDRIADYVADYVFRLKPNARSVLEVGVGEYTTLVAAVKKTGRQPERLVGLDISWSRLRLGEKHAAEQGVRIEKSVMGNIFSLPFLNDSFDVVYTHYCIEQSPFNNEKVLGELHRVARSHVVLMEPSYELGNSIQKKRMLIEDYVRGLPRSLKRLGFKVIRHEPLPISTYQNRGAVWIIEKNAALPGHLPTQYLACPQTLEPLEEIHRQFFCRKLGMVYPVLDGIACLQPDYAIRAAKFAYNQQPTT
ncbi:MAG: methyltransferase domain-containing protein [Nevskiales bacterium]